MQQVLGTQTIKYYIISWPGCGGEIKETQLTIMLLLVTFCYLLLTSPQYIRYILFANVDILKDVDTFSKMSLLYQITQKCLFTNRLDFLYLVHKESFSKENQSALTY